MDGIIQLIDNVKSFIDKQESKPQLLFIGTKETLSKYEDSIKATCIYERGILVSFKYVPEDYLICGNDKIIVVNEKEINMKPLKFKYNFDLTNRWDYDIVDTVKKIIMEKNKNERN